MNGAPLLARLHDRPGALERAIGLIRRRAHGIHRISVASARNVLGGGQRDDVGDLSLERASASPHSAAAGSRVQSVIELVLRVDESRTPRERVRRDLLGLEDLIDVRDLGGEASATRELLLVWIRSSDAAARASQGGRVIAVSGPNSLLEVTGTPADIDELLTRLDEAGALMASVRSGEVAAPGPEQADEPQLKVDSRGVERSAKL